MKLPLLPGWITFSVHGALWISMLKFSTGLTFCDHVPPIVCDIRLPCNVEVSALDDSFTAPNGSNVRWENSFDDRLLTYIADLDFVALNMWYEVLGYNDPKCDNSEHNFKLR